MTNTTRTIADIEAALVQIEKLIDDTEAFNANMLDPLTSNGAQCVIGFPHYGFYLNEAGTMGGLPWARRFDIHAAVRFPTVRNGRGEVAEIVTVGLAANKSISLNENVITDLWGMYRDNERELCERYDAMADEAAMQDEWNAACAERDADYLDQRYDAWKDARAEREQERLERDVDARQDR